MTQKSHPKPLSLALGPGLGALLAGTLTLTTQLQSAPIATAAVTLCCAVWWITEALPVAATALLPFVAFPFLGVASPAQLSEAYGHPLILLLLGGFMLSSAMEGSGAHRRLALTLVRILGGDRAPRLVLGFMLTSALLSMWISNSATTLMLLPVALALVDTDAQKSLRAPLLLGVAYGASIGGLGTPIGSPPNAVFMAVYQEVTGNELTFVDWMKFGAPTVCFVLPVAWWLLVRGLPARIALSLPETEPWRPAERRTVLVFAVTALCWVTRTAPGGGWGALLPGTLANDSTVALVAALSLFLIPDGSGGALMTWSRAKQIPWGLLLLFAGGLAIAKAFETSTLSQTVGQALASLSDWPSLVLTGVLCLAVTFLTEVTSNTATASLLMPVLGGAAQAAGMEPMTLMVPAVLSTSCAFMLPVATAPNAIVFGTGHVSSKQMARAGLRLNLAVAVLITLLCQVLI